MEHALPQQENESSSDHPNPAQPPIDPSTQPPVDPVNMSRNPTTRRRFVRNLMEAIMNGIASQGDAGNTAQQPAGNPSATTPQDFLQFLRSRPATAGDGRTIHPPIPVDGPAGLESFMRAIRGRRTGAEGSPEGGIQIPAGGPGRSPVPVLILIGRAVRATPGNTGPTAADDNTTTATGDAPAPPANEGMSVEPPHVPSDASEQNSHQRTMEHLFGEFATGGPSVTSFADSLLANQSDPPSSPPQNHASSSTNEPTPNNSDEPPQREGDITDPSTPMARRSISFMIYFLPNQRPGTANANTNGETEVQGPVTRSSTETDRQQQPTATESGTAEAAGTAEDPDRFPIPLAEMFGGMPEGVPPLPHIFARRGPARPPTTTTNAGASMPLPQQTADTDTPTQQAPPTDNPQPPRTMIESFAVTIILQIVSNLLREGSMNGPGGLLGGTLSLDILGDGPPGGGGGDGMSYDDLVRLSEMLGPARPRHAGMEDVERELPVLKWSAGGDTHGMEKGKDTAITESQTEWGKDTLLRISDLVPSTREKCMICLTSYEEGDEIRVMRCLHGFHKGCLDEWVTGYVNSCPLCRGKAVVGVQGEQGTVVGEESRGMHGGVGGGLGGGGMTQQVGENTTQQGGGGENSTQAQGGQQRRGLFRRVMDIFGGGGGGGNDLNGNGNGSGNVNVNANGEGGATQGRSGLPLPAAVIVLLGG